MFWLGGVILDDSGKVIGMIDFFFIMDVFLESRGFVYIYCGYWIYGIYSWFVMLIG